MGKINRAGVCALVVALAGVMSLPIARGQEQDAGHQEDNPFEGGGEARGESGNGPAYAARRIEWILDQPLRSPLEYPETPLNTIAGIISEEYELPVVFDTKALDAMAVSPEVEVTVDLRNMTLRSAFELMLNQVEGLTYVVDHEVMSITTQDEANSRLETRIYRIDDLSDCQVTAPPPAGASAWADFDPLVDVITSCVERDSWVENGTGSGVIQPLPPGMLVVTQTAQIHRQIAELLEGIRRVKREIEDAPAKGKAEGTGEPLASSADDEEDGH